MSWGRLFWRHLRWWMFWTIWTACGFGIYDVTAREWVPALSEAGMMAVATVFCAAAKELAE